ncbi:UDP-N-acetylmuramate--L-alanine ligase [Clostridium guangxiense]|uniref:UDP-N-acetylmuramate--L-alanine ligase n=1 Tax=Clostridium guangxiense TaxID=1662055 RepID=UPI001E3D3A80|nr:UDP-N-acetylmuramate--L-alanine ligase [Clostridium guangxiense]MCD2347859.1 UDP-N-acetylmuramate--L-alanine ligase [Clostridium guangxiense]
MSFNFKHDSNKKIHFIGIGGVSMSGLAEILLEHNYKVSGSDAKKSLATDKLEKNGAEIYIGHNSSNINNVDLIVYTAAIPNDNPELIRAKELNIPLVTRAEFLGTLMKDHKFNVAVSGTHGKTTTTSIISHIVLKANLDPTILVGGDLDIIGGNVRAGKSDYFITEACEYKASFLQFFPYIGVILDIDADHLDYYKDIDDIERTFTKFSNLIPEDGYLIANYDDERTARVASKAKCNIVSYGIENGKITAKNIGYDDHGCAVFDVYNGNKFLFNIRLNIPGKHNILNTLASIATALVLDIDANSIIAGIQSFNGTHRRFEIKGTKDGVTVIDDYAHHPTEIKATLAAAQNYPHERIFCVFQPHTYSRTQSLFNEFANAFSNVDALVLADIYAAREKDTGVVSSNMLGDEIRKNGVPCKNLHSFDDIVTYLKGNLTEGDVLFTIGAGDVYKVGEMFLEQK